MTALQKTVRAMARTARAASTTLLDVTEARINKALITVAAALEKNTAALRRENSKDLENGRARGLSSAMLDRLALSDKAVAAMTQGLREVARLPSPLGGAYDARIRPNRLKVYKVRVPIGVIGIIYESRPNVTIDSAALCLKAGNAVILRGGSEAFRSNTVLTDIFRDALERCGVPKDAVQLIPSTDRAAIDTLLTLENDVDLIIPRGGESLIRAVVEKSRIPVIKHYKGVCHIYVAARADMKKVLPVVVNAKVQRPGVCNAMETLLLDSKLSAAKRTAIIQALLDKKVTLYGDPATREISSAIRKASEKDWYAEYLDLRLAVRTVTGVNEAIEHINTYGSRHTDAIMTESDSEADRFCRLVDSASVIVNASTRFADGGEYGMGCEIGISTDKLHARGPMGLEELTTYKWIVQGNGQIRM